jgi:hypothetical protein
MELPRESGNYSFNEKVMIAKIYRYFLNPASFNLPHTKLQPRKLVSLILGVGETTIGRIMSDVNSNNGVLPVLTPMGRPIKAFDQEYVAEIRSYILSCNGLAIPLTATHIKLHLETKGYVFGASTIKRHLRLLGYYYGKGERRNILHESTQVTAYRSKYLKNRMENLMGTNDVPNRPEIFLDESYCHLDHASRLTWLPKGGVVYEQGRKPLLVIFGAMAVWRNGVSNKVDAGEYRYVIAPSIHAEIVL